ncbi:MAG: hypothetical protein JJ911_16895 [Rhizobiaceae bacterium]|nr:hypothetical protein [Rhizobiaceae bacterium]
MRRAKVLAIAAGTGRIAYVFLVGKKLRYWHVSYAASYSPSDAASHARGWIAQVQPDVLVIQRRGKGYRKGRQASANMEAIAQVAEQQNLIDIEVEKRRRFPNKYSEAEALAKRFPELQRWVPKARRLWDPEPKNITIFEALALALEVVDPPPEPKKPRP